MKRILIIDDDVFICNVLEKHLFDNGYKVESAFSSATGRKLLKERKFDLVLCDYRLPESDGFKMLEIIRSIQPDAKVVIITAYADARIAVQLIKKGADDYIVKPIQQEELLHLVGELLHANSVEVPKNKLKNKSGKPDDFFFGNNKEFKEVLSMAEKVAPTNMSVLIEGATGSGKEYLAKYIHEHSERKNQPFVALDCGAIPKSLANSELFGHRKGSFTGALSDKTGVFQEADGGTLLLDEVGNMDYEVQVKLLRTLQERKITRVGDPDTIDVDVRIIAASNEDLKKEVEKGNFREDLFHRLNEFYLKIPQLRDRAEDIIAFAEYFVALANTQLGKNVTGIDDHVKSVFRRYAWEGNIRELKNIIKRSVLLTQKEFITTDVLPEEIKNFHLYETAMKDNSADLRTASFDAEREKILKTLRSVDNNKSKAARKLNIDRKTLYNKMKKLNIDLTPEMPDPDQ